MSDKGLIAEARTIAKHSAVSLPDHADCLLRLADALEAATSERDAAVAARDAIRKLHEPFEAAAGRTYCGECSGVAGSGNLRFWPCPTVAALDGAPEPDNYDQCDAEVYSWDHYRPEQIDSYWIRCTMLGTHDEHEDSHTGLKWRSGLPVEGEKP